MDKPLVSVKSQTYDIDWDKIIKLAGEKKLIFTIKQGNGKCFLYSKNDKTACLSQDHVECGYLQPGGITSVEKDSEEAKTQK
jgi:hypothetical protein